jgi:hypothetical protein
MNIPAVIMSVNIVGRRASYATVQKFMIPSSAKASRHQEALHGVRIKMPYQVITIQGQIQGGRSRGE